MNYNFNKPSDLVFFFQGNHFEISSWNPDDGHFINWAKLTHRFLPIEDNETSKSLRSTKIDLSKVTFVG